MITWKTVRRVLLVSAAGLAVISGYLPDDSPGSLRTITLGSGLAAAAMAGVIAEWET